MRTCSKAVLTFVLALPAALLAPPAAARTLTTQKEALALAFPEGIQVERRTAYLTDEQRKAAESAGRVKVESAVWWYYIGSSTAGPAGFAYFDTHVVRTMPETIMVALEPGGTVRFVEILSFSEPDDYLPGSRWLAQLRGRRLDADLAVRRGVRNITGASLTAEAVADAVRRVLAVHRTLHGEPAPEKVKSSR